MAGKTHRIGKSLIEIQKSFGTDEQCQAYLESARWPEGVRCLKCNGDKVSKFTSKGRERINRKGETVRSPDRHLYQCLDPECGHQFTTTTGTLFNDSHLPLSKWFLAIGIMCNAKKSVSAKQMERDLGVNYRTAWYLNHRIRKAMDEGIEGMFTGTVEVDETYVGGRYDKRRKREAWEKQGVIGALQRNTAEQPSQVRVEKIDTPSKTVLTGFVRKNVSTDAEILYTDEYPAYKSLKADYRHEIVRHKALEYVRGDVHTQSIENFWSLFKRGVIGSFHKISIKHLDRYLAEFCFRFNHRRNEELFALTILNLVIAAAMPYAVLIGKTSASAQPSEADPF
jgi:hypothetical protein